VPIAVSEEVIMKHRYIMPVIFIGLIVSSGFIAFWVYRNLRQAGMESCILSLEAPIIVALDNREPEFTDSLGSQWKTLSSEESKNLLNEAVAAGKTDCGTFQSVQQGKDYWGNDIRIALRKSAVRKAGVRIWSIGPDGRENTLDDITAER
jgi:hypothetical protein